MHNLPKLPDKRAATILLALLVLGLGWSRAEAAAVSGAYQSVSGNRAVFLIQIGSPAPSSLIVEHLHPRGTRLTAATPGADKVAPGSGTTKWFLKNPRPGSHRFSLSFDRPVAGAGLRLILRYRDPRNGSFTETVVQP